MHLRRLKDVAKKTSFLRCIWDISKTSQKRRLFWDVSEMSLRCLSQRRPNWDVSETSHAGWVTTLTFHVCFSSIYEFKFTSFLILAISNPGDSYKLLQRQKIQPRGNKFMTRTKTNKNIGVKIKTKRRKGLYVITIQLLSLSGGWIDCHTEFPLTTALSELSAPLISSTSIQIHFYRHLTSIKRSW